jgi:hypothetical protein
MREPVSGHPKYCGQDGGHSTTDYRKASHPPNLPDASTMIALANGGSSREKDRAGVAEIFRPEDGKRPSHIQRGTEAKKYQVSALHRMYAADLSHSAGQHKLAIFIARFAEKE